MAKKVYTEEYIQAIADAIREKNGLNDTYTVGEMGEAILNLPTSSSYTRLFYAECVGADAAQIPVINTLTTSEDYVDYLSYDDTSRIFTVLQPFSALIVLWTYQYRDANTYGKGAFYVNNENISKWAVAVPSQGGKGGKTLFVDFSQGDTFHLQTPNSDGWPQQFCKLYKADNAGNLTPLLDYTDENS